MPWWLNEDERMHQLVHQMGMQYLHPDDPKYELRMDVMILWDQCPKIEANLPRLLMLCKYFNYKDGRYAEGCKRRLQSTVKLLGQAKRMDWQSYQEHIDAFNRGAAISRRLRGKSTDTS